jgi:hypothetical protein
VQTRTKVAAPLLLLALAAPLHAGGKDPVCKGGDKCKDPSRDTARAVCVDSRSGDKPCDKCKDLCRDLCQDDRCRDRCLATCTERCRDFCADRGEPPNCADLGLAATVNCLCTVRGIFSPSPIDKGLGAYCAPDCIRGAYETARCYAEKRAAEEPRGGPAPRDGPTLPR